MTVSTVDVYDDNRQLSGRISNDVFKKRIANCPPVEEQILLGPRQTGKSSLIRNELKPDKYYNLLTNSVFLEFTKNPSLLQKEITSKDKVVVIDEIQRIPELLNEVHSLIEEKGVRFLLTGSSVRKLRRGGTNLLGGRARTRILHPFVSKELGEDFNLKKALSVGTIPSIYFSDLPLDDLNAYIGDYLKQEISDESVTRNVPAFSRFLEVAALCNAQLINYTQIGSDAQVARTTVREYFQILTDTLIATTLEPWLQTKKRKPIETQKFYFFDTGVARSLQGRTSVKEQSPEFGESFETYIFHELKSWLDYSGKTGLHFWRSTSGFEVDFILCGSTAIDVKAKKNITERDLRGLQALMEEKGLKNYIVVSLVERTRVEGKIRILPYSAFLRELWNGCFA